jgi:hypothetical protein
MKFYYCILCDRPLKHDETKYCQECSDKRVERLLKEVKDKSKGDSIK